ncbi:MAG: AAA family ATPase [Chloroflexota bacterium]
MTEHSQPTAPASAPFVGRHAELDALLQALDEATRGRGRVALIGGEPGIGKSRLAEQLAVRARERELPVLIGRGWEGAGAPAYWPWVQVIRTIIRSTDTAVLRELLGPAAPDIAQIVPDLRDLLGDLPRPTETESDSARFQLFDSATTFLRRAAEATPLVIVIDDLHAADMPTVLLLRFLASQLADARILVVCTYREAELAADPPLSEAVGEIARQPAATTLSLTGLGEEPVRELIAATAGLSPRPRLVSTILRMSGGNPLFLGEAVRLMAAEGRLEQAGLASAVNVPLPAGVRDVIVRRVRLLPPDAAAALIHAAALGPEFSVEVLRRVTDATAEEVLDRLGAATRAGLVSPVATTLGRYRFAHDLMRETLYDQLPPGRRVGLHRRIADTLQTLYGASPDAYLAELAYHYVEASRGGEPDAPTDAPSVAELAVRYARDAGDLALRSLAYEEAARLHRMGLAVLNTHAPGDAAQRIEVLLSLGEAEARAGDLTASRQTFLEAAHLARRQGAPAALARAVLGYGGRFFWARVGHDTHLIPLLQDALLLLPEGTDDRLRVRLLTRLACGWRSAPERQEQRRALSTQAVEMARSLGDLQALSYALVGHYWAVWVPDNPEERLDIATEMLAVAEGSGEAERLIDSHMMFYLVYMDLGRIADARAEIDVVFNLARELRQPGQLWLTFASNTVLALLDGDFREAERTLAVEIEPGMPTTPVQDDVSASRMHRFLLRREQGRSAEEERSTRASVDAFPWYPLHRGALALLLLDADRNDEARAVFDDLATDEFRALYPDCEWLLGMAFVSEACAGLGAAADAEILYRRLLPFAGGHAIGHTEGSVGPVARYLGLLAGTMGRDDDAVEHLEAAITVGQRLGATPWVAHAQRDLATALRRRGAAGDAGRAAELTVVARATAERLGMVALLATLDGASQSAAPIRPSPARATFRREGEYWTVEFESGAVRVRDAKGMQYLARLLAQPGQELHALDLAGTESGHARRVATSDELLSSGLGDAGPQLDEVAKAAYRDRVTELRREVAEAEEWNDPERAARAQAEIAAIAHELAGAVGLGGRDRVAASPAERARIAVSRAIRSSMQRIARQEPALGAHLDATIRTGAFCSYAPDPRSPIAWQV